MAGRTQTRNAGAFLFARGLGREGCARATCRPRRHAQRPFGCTRSGCRGTISRSGGTTKRSSTRLTSARCRIAPAIHAFPSAGERTRRLRAGEPHRPSAARPAHRGGNRTRRGAQGVRFEYDRGRFVTFTPDELRALDVETSKTIDLATFVPRAAVDPLYFNAPYYVYPEPCVTIGDHGGPFIEPDQHDPYPRNQ